MTNTFFVKFTGKAAVDLSKSGLSSWHIAPLLDNWLLDLPWVGARPGAHLLGDVNTLLCRLEEGHKLGDVPALALGLKVACLLRNLVENNTYVMKESNLFL